MTKLIDKRIESLLKKGLTSASVTDRMLKEGNGQYLEQFFNSNGGNMDQSGGQAYQKVIDSFGEGTQISIPEDAAEEVAKLLAYNLNDLTDEEETLIETNFNQFFSARQGMDWSERGNYNDSFPDMVEDIEETYSQWSD